MTTKHMFDVNSIIEAAAKEHGAPVPVPGGKRRKALNKMIRLRLREMGIQRQGKSYKVPATVAFDLIKYDMRGYLTKFFTDNQSDPKIEKAKRSTDQAKEDLRNNRKAMENADPLERMEELHQWEQQARIDERVEIPQAQYTAMLLKALQRAVFPAFNEAQFRLEYAEYSLMQPDLELPSPDAASDPAQVRAMMRASDLLEKLEPALFHGDLSAYMTLKRDA